MSERNYTIDPPFDEKLNKRLGASGTDSHPHAVPNTPTSALDIEPESMEARLEEARAEERSACALAASNAADAFRLSHDGNDSSAIHKATGANTVYDAILARGKSNEQKDE